MGVILDVSFPQAGLLDRQAGRAFAGHIQTQNPDLPIVIQSGSDNADLVGDLGLEFIDKHSRSLLQDIRAFMQDRLSFGDFLFKLSDGTLVSKANDLRSFAWAIQAIPGESLLYHSDRNNFRTWLSARGEIEIAESFRAISSHGRVAAEVRRDILGILASHRNRSAIAPGAPIPNLDRRPGSGPRRPETIRPGSHSDHCHGDRSDEPGSCV